MLPIFESLRRDGCRRHTGNTCTHFNTNNVVGNGNILMGDDEVICKLKQDETRAQALETQCKATHYLTKYWNGCRAYWRGFKKGDYSCHNCGSASRDYFAGSWTECRSLCSDLYSGGKTDSSMAYCKKGCDKYHELTGKCSLASTLLNSNPRFIPAPQIRNI